MNLANIFQSTDDAEWPVYKTYEQLCILVLDGSSSMREKESASGVTKAEAVEKACVELLTRLQSSITAEQFWLSAITFDQRVECLLPPTPVQALQESDLALNLLANHGGNTAIGDALAQAGQVVEEFLHEEDPNIPRYAVILLMSDGQNNSGEDPLIVTQRLKAQFSQRKPHGSVLTLATAAYGDDASANTLTQIAGNEQFHRRVENGAQLRDFFFSSVSRSLAEVKISNG